MEPIPPGCRTPCGYSPDSPSWPKPNAENSRRPGGRDRTGYSVHICADPEALCAHAIMDDFVVDPSIVPFLGQWNRHYPVPGAPPLPARFKEEFEKHNEFLPAPAIRRADGTLYLEPRLGIIKNIIFFRQLSDITTPDDTDAAAPSLPQLITPPA